MEQSTRKEMPQESSLWKRLAVGSSATLLFAGILYFAVDLSRYALAPSRFPIWMRLPLFMGPSLLVLLAIWFVFQLAQLRAKDRAKKAGRPIKMGPRVEFWANADQWALPALMTFFIVSLAFSMFAMASMIWSRPNALWLRGFCLVNGVIFLLLSLVWPIRAIRRKRKLGRFLLSQEEVKVARGPKPLWKRKLAAGLWSFCAVCETVAAVLKDHDRVFSWVLAVFFWGLAAWSFWEIDHPLVPSKASSESETDGAES
jgi:hypothetical protein